MITANRHLPSGEGGGVGGWGRVGAKMINDR